jgi:molybdopterin synthase sulfur carrier subunit
MIRDTISVLLFARYAELLGATVLKVPQASAADVAALVGYLRSLPGGAQLPERPLVAVNMKQVDLSHRLNPDDEVAFLPPMAGG